MYIHIAYELLYIHIRIHIHIRNELLHDNITKTYKHGSEDFIDEIDSELKETSSRLGIGDRIERMKKREAFIFKRSQRKFREQSKMPIN